MQAVKEKTGQRKVGYIYSQDVIGLYLRALPFAKIWIAWSLRRQPKEQMSNL